MNASATVVIDVWSDYVCPFCYLEEPVLDRIRARYGDAVEVVWHAFELRPEPVPTLEPDGEYLRSTWARAVYPMAAERGMTLRLPPVQPRSRRALEAAEFARDAGCYEAMHTALFRAFFEHGQDIGRDEVLLEVGRSVGLVPEDLRQALQEGRYTQRVLDEERQAQALDIRGVPLLRIRHRAEPLQAARALSGAQPYEVVAAAVERALAGGPPAA